MNSCVFANLPQCLKQHLLPHPVQLLSTVWRWFLWFISGLKENVCILWNDKSPSRLHIPFFYQTVHSICIDPRFVACENVRLPFCFSVWIVKNFDFTVFAEAVSPICYSMRSHGFIIANFGIVFNGRAQNTVRGCVNYRNKSILFMTIVATLSTRKRQDYV